MRLSIGMVVQLHAEEHFESSALWVRTASAIVSNIIYVTKVGVQPIVVYPGMPSATFTLADEFPGDMFITLEPIPGLPEGVPCRIIPDMVSRIISGNCECGAAKIGSPFHSHYCPLADSHWRS